MIPPPEAQCKLDLGGAARLNEGRPHGRQRELTPTSSSKAEASRGSDSQARWRRSRSATYRPQNIAGTSAGAITAALLAAGYSAAELREIIISLDYRQFQDRAWEDKMPLIERSLSMLLDLGLYEGDRFLHWIRERLEAKGVRTFADLVHDEFADDPRYRSRLQVIASDVTTHELLVLPRDATKLGIEPDDARRRARGPDEHEHPRLLRARPLREPEDRRRCT